MYIYTTILLLGAVNLQMPEMTLDLLVKSDPLTPGLSNRQLGSLFPVPPWRPDQSNGLGNTIGSRESTILSVPT